MSDTALRYLAMLRLIPRYPQMISTAELRKRLEAQGFKIDVRSVQRNLSALEAHHEIAISCETRGVINYWFWPEHAKVFDMPVFSVGQALAISLIADYGPELLPAGFLQTLKPYVERADEMLKGAGSERIRPYADWRKKVHMIRKAPVLHAPTVDAKAVEQIYLALLDGRQLKGKYRSRGSSKPRAISIDPVGLVVKQGVSYLVAVHEGYEDFRHHALHRFSGAQAQKQRARVFLDFDLEAYARESFAYPEREGREVKLDLRVAENVAEHLRERPLSDGQKISESENGWCTIRATVPLTEELRWWLLSHGPQLVVNKPLTLRREMKEVVAQMQQLYQ